MAHFPNFVKTFWKNYMNSHIETTALLHRCSFLWPLVAMTSFHDGLSLSNYNISWYNAIAYRFLLMSSSQWLYFGNRHMHTRTHSRLGHIPVWDTFPLGIRFRISWKCWIKVSTWLRVEVRDIWLCEHCHGYRQSLKC